MATHLIGSLRPVPTHSAFSEESAQRARDIVPRATDVFIATPPKTFARRTQLHHCLRVGCAATHPGPTPRPFIHTAFTSKVDYKAWLSGPSTESVSQKHPFQQLQDAPLSVCTSPLELVIAWLLLTAPLSSAQKEATDAAWDVRAIAFDDLYHVSP